MNPPKKKVIGIKVTRTPGAVVQKGAPASVNTSFERGKSTSSYAPTKVETGHPAYGKPGGGTDKEMNRLLSDAHAKKKDVTDFSSKGLTYKAGTTTRTTTPAKFHTGINVRPEIRKVNMNTTPLHEKAKSTSGGHLKPRAVTLGGSDKKGNPANKSGIGTKKRVMITKVKSFPKYK